jgi:hypothetical protein
MIKRLLLLAAATLALLSGSALADLQQFLTAAISNYGGVLMALFGMVLAIRSCDRWIVSLSST